MKKVFVILLVLMLCGCSSGVSKQDNAQRYYDMVELIQERDKFDTKPQYFKISYDVSKSPDGYRYYLIIDDPKIAMYDVEAIAIEKGSDHSLQMAANIGIFEDMEYNLIPNQSNADKGYVKGISISATSQNKDTVLYLLIQWKNASMSTTFREFYEIEVSSND